MAIVHTVNGSALVAPASVQLQDETNGFETRAKLGEVGIVNIFVDDPEGALTFVERKPWLVSEDTAPAGSQVFWAGFIGDVTWSRVGNGRTYPVGAGRVWEIQLVEANTYLVRRKLRKEATTTARPAETVSARIAWLLTTPGMSGVVVDAGLVAASAVVMDASTGDGYHNQDAAAVLRDCALYSGFNYHIRYREATADYELLFYDPRTWPFDTSTLVISNVKAEVDGATTFAPNPEAKGRRYADRLASGVIVVKEDGSDVYDTNSTTASTYAAVDVVAPTPPIKTTSAAEAQVAHLLTQHSTPEEAFECEIEVPAASVTIVKAGQLVSAKLTHGPGWESGRQCRATKVIPRRPPNLTQGRYRIGLELQPAEDVVFVASHARLMRPVDNDAWTGTYTVDLAWRNDGEDFAAGDNSCLPGGVADPATGLLAYNPTPKPGTGWESILVGGTGTLSLVAAKADFIGVSTGGLTTALFEILRNDSVIASANASDNTAGAHNQGWTLTASVADVAVYAGDILRARWTVAGNWAGPGQIPAGVGTCDAYLLATGDLVAP